MKLATIANVVNPTVAIPLVCRLNIHPIMAINSPPSHIRPKANTPPDSSVMLPATSSLSASPKSKGGLPAAIRALHQKGKQMLVPCVSDIILVASSCPHIATATHASASMSANSPPRTALITPIWAYIPPVNTGMTNRSSILTPSTTMVITTSPSSARNVSPPDTMTVAVKAVNPKAKAVTNRCPNLSLLLLPHLPYSLHPSASNNPRPSAVCEPGPCLYWTTDSSTLSTRERTPKANNVRMIVIGIKLFFVS